MNYFNFKNALIKKSVVEDGYKYTVTVDGKDIAAGSIQGLVNVLNELYRMPKTDILDEIFGDDFQWCDINPISYSAKIKAAIDIEKYGRGHIKNYKGLCLEGLSEEGNTLARKKYGTGTPLNIVLQYAIEDVDTDWNYLTFDTPVSFAKGQKVYVRNVSDIDDFDYQQFITTGAIKLSGNIQSVAKNGQKFEKNNVAGCFQGLFSRSDDGRPNNIVDVSELKLPATELVPYCYSGLLRNNKDLTGKLPELPAIEMTDHCYNGMFSFCSNIETAPELPAKVLDTYCYNAMFMNCSSLTTAPELPATELAEHCYDKLFRGCTNLNYIKVNFTDWTVPDSTPNWVNSVAATGTFVKPAALEEIRGINNIPEGWTIVNK